MKLAIVILLLVAVAYGAREQDLMKSPLPGCSQGNFKQYSGYLDVTADKKFHYIYVESEQAPADKPVVFWFNGGPGCSSMIGYIQEHGPCVFLEDSDHAPRDNPYSWNKFANMVYLESPAGVGYNFYSGHYHYNDENVSYENLKAVVEFFKAYPELKNHELFLSGESYGGIYIPYLALRIHEYNQNSTDQLNLRGFMIGNGVTNWKYDTTQAFVKMGWAHGLYDNALKERIDKLNCDFADVGAKPQSAECKKVLKDFGDNVAQVYPYDIYRPQESAYNSNQMSVEGLLRLESDSDNQAGSYARFSQLFKNKPRNDFAVVDRFMNNAEAKAAMNIPANYSWRECSNINYEMLEKATQWIYPILKDQYRMMHYSGDTDGVVPTIGTEGWMEDLGWPVTKKYTAWMADKYMIGGYTQSRGSLDLITIHGCGHMAPQWKRQPAFTAISKWLANEELPRAN